MHDDTHSMLQSRHINHRPYVGELKENGVRLLTPECVCLLLLIVGSSSRYCGRDGERN
jgi:hypothetical protein